MARFAEVQSPITLILPRSRRNGWKPSKGKDYAPSTRVRYPLLPHCRAAGGAEGIWIVPPVSQSSASVPRRFLPPWHGIQRGYLMGRPRSDQRYPMRRFLADCRAGEGVEPAHKDHVEAVCREAVQEAEERDFGIFEEVAAAMTLRLYSRSLASQDAITCARALGEVIRSLRALRLLGTASRLQGGSVFQSPRKRGRSRSVFTPRAGEEGEA